MPEFHIRSITWDLEYNIDSDITLYTLYNGAAFRICYVAEQLTDSPSILKQHHELYAILYEDDPEGNSREAAKCLRRPFEELMMQLAPDPLTESARSLHSYLYPPSFILEATVAESHVQPRLKAALSRQEFIRPGDYVDSKFIRQHLSPLASRLEKYSSRQVQVLAHTPRLVPSMVCVDCTTYFFKPWVSGRVHGYHELQAYEKILAAAKARPSLLHNAYICRLHGLIIDQDDDVLQHYRLDSDEEDYPGTRLVGLLLTHIENKGTLKDLAPWSDCIDEDRARWSRQICDSVQCLHAAGVVWGDAKPENVLIGKDGNAYLIDFGGSYTRGWVDEDKRETMKGDLQGVKRIGEWLDKWSEKPVTRVQEQI
ncbi:hypothetical protein E0Z10_g3670 [Xylaria hypoxylon]|uniref:Protein kinase domain-containing protein n=1 Tax=Xylaria hypoxylon TaxID=37992 RepID=A0A4Z0YMG5_9PEZI|nr:hypothetical protein E0Z10_g3670 [Xylaria hypoxylon]